MMTSKQEASRWVRKVTVSDPQKHPENDFTVYKVRLQLIPVSTVDDEKEITIYKRYNDFKKLYFTLSTYHKKLQRREPFPELVKANFFDRHDPEVVENRRASAEEVLNFCCQHFYLHNHDTFRIFFASGLKRTVQVGTNQSVSADSTSAPPDLLTCTISDTTSNLSGSFQSLANTSDDVFGRPLEPVVSEDAPASRFRCSGALDAGDTSTMTGRRKDLVAPPPLVPGWEDDNSDSGSCDGSSIPTEHKNTEETLNSFDYPTVLEPSADLSLFDPCYTSPSESGNSRVSNLAALSSLPSNSGAVGVGKVKSFFTNLRGNKKAGISGQDGETAEDGEEETYIEQASAFAARGDLLEKSEDWEGAFNAFNMAVAVLLQGVQGEDEPVRRKLVRDNTALYLDRAEKIKGDRLGNISPSRVEGENRWTPPASLIPSNSVGLSMSSHLISLYAPVTSLSNYKVLGIIGRVQLVFDKSTATSYVIKCIRKSPLPADPLSVPTLVSPYIPYMVRLHRIIDTVQSIVLVLEHTTGSLLAEWVCEFTRRDLDNPTTPCLGGIDPRSRRDPGDARVYEGRRLLNLDENPSSDANVTDVPTDQIWSSRRDTDSDSSSSSANSLSDTSKTTNQHTEGYLALFQQASVPQHPEEDSKRRHITNSVSWGSLDAPIDSISQSGVKREDECGRKESCSSFGQVLQDAVESGEGLGRHQFTLMGESMDSDSRWKTPEDQRDSVFNFDHLDSSSAGMDKIPEDKVSDPRKASRSRRWTNEMPNVKPPALQYRRSFSSGNDEIRSLDGGDRQLQPPTSPLNTTSRSHPDLESSHPTSPHQSHPDLHSHPTPETDVEAGFNRRWSVVFEQFAKPDHVKEENRVPENCLRQWAAELVIAVGALHKKGIILRDLHRENVLLGPGGHLRLTFFSQWTQSPPDLTWQPGRYTAESNLFVAPELFPQCQLTSMSSRRRCSSGPLASRGGPLAADWWSVGAVLYELFTYCALVACHPQGLTSHSKLYLPNWLSPEAADLLTKLLKVDPNERLGGSMLDAEEVKLHPFFTGIDWEEVTKNG